MYISSCIRLRKDLSYSSLATLMLLDLGPTKGPTCSVSAFDCCCTKHLSQTDQQPSKSHRAALKESTVREKVC